MGTTASHRPQPAVGILALRRITKRAVARHLGLSEQWVSAQLLGRARPCAPLRLGLAQLLDMPEEDLFLSDIEGANGE